MISFLRIKLKDYFIPSTLVFMIKPPRNKDLRQFYYSDLKKTDKKLDPKYFEILKHYFDNMSNSTANGYAVPFNNLALELPPDSFDQDFLDLKPKHIIPLLGIGGAYGIVMISEKNNGEPFSANDMFYLHRMFAVLAVTMQNGLHYEISITDPKTGLFTYDFFLTRMDEAIGNMRRYKQKA